MTKTNTPKRLSKHLFPLLNHKMKNPCLPQTPSSYKSSKLSTKPALISNSGPPIRTGRLENKKDLRKICFLNSLPLHHPPHQPHSTNSVMPSESMCSTLCVQQTGKSTYSLIFNTFAGTPTTVALSNTSSTTAAPAPIVHHFPMLTQGITEAPAPIKVPSPT